MKGVEGYKTNFSYKINKSSDAQHGGCNQFFHSTYWKVAKRVNPKSSHHKKKPFFLGGEALATDGN